MKIFFTKLYIYFSWLPLAIYFLAFRVVNRSHGWGAWAAGRILIYPILFSLLFGILGILLIVTSKKTKNLNSKLVIATLLSGGLGLWFLGLAIIKEILMSF